MKKLFLLIIFFEIHSNQKETTNHIIEKKSKRQERREKRQEFKEKQQQEALLKQQQEELEDRDTLSFSENVTDSLPSLTIQNKSNEPKKVSFYSFPLVFTEEGINSFFNHSFNREEYGKEFLPHNLSHLGQIICHGYENNLSQEFTEASIRLFYQKIKSSPYISAPAFERFLDQTVPYLEMQLSQKDFSLIREIKELLISTFKSHFMILQEDPLNFFDHVSKELNETIYTHTLSPERARNTLIKFLNSVTDKIIWSPDDQFTTWTSFKKIGTTLEYLHTCKVIPDQFDANDLYWSLVERYCYFLELVGTKLKLETLQSIKHDITTNTPPWLLTQEQEAAITTKLEKIARKITETETRIIAQNNGIFTEKIFKIN